MKPAVAIGVYEAAWRAASPFLARAPRLSKGFSQRLLNPPPAKADLWIQAASVGEAYLAIRLLKALRPRNNTRVLVTTGTDQGLEVLTSALSSPAACADKVTVSCGYFPFDRPSLMDWAIVSIGPKLLVLMETEIWPGLLRALKRHAVPSLILNGRLSEKSFKGYQWVKPILSRFPVDRILAVSKADVRRFSALFGKERVSLMHNMKFDEITPGDPTNPSCNFLDSVSHPFVVLGSIRQEEEASVTRLLLRLKEKLPTAIIALFPRHASRHGAWADILKSAGVDWAYRSSLSSISGKGTVILWDTFGELGEAYRHAEAVFVGGTLAPLGGQNFLEPLMAGVRPVIGPHWDHFKWVGETIFRQHLVRIANDWMEAANLLMRDIESHHHREVIRSNAISYLDDHRGGTATAARVVESMLESQS
jgi:3-deoxy-D-manno-octulosonic-acid transferase